MSKITKHATFDGDSRPNYALLTEIANATGGWVRSSGGEHGEAIKVWHGDTEYVFQGRAVIDFLYAKKDQANRGLDAAAGLVAYIEESSNQPPSRFVRDAIVLKAREVKAILDG